MATKATKFNVSNSVGNFTRDVRSIAHELNFDIELIEKVRYDNKEHHRFPHSLYCAIVRRAGIHQDNDPTKKGALIITVLNKQEMRF